MKYILPEAGGDAARSAFYFLRDAGVKSSDIMAVDRNWRALVVWSQLLHCKTVTEESAKSMINDDDVVVPCDEFFRERYGIIGTSSLYSNIYYSNLMSLFFNKRLMHLFLESNILDYSKLPERVNPNNYKGLVVCRGVRSSGSRSLEMFELPKDKNLIKEDSHNFILTEYIPFDDEIVCDFVTMNGKVSCSTRITHLLRNGADTFVEILDTNSQIYKMVESATEEVVKVLKYDGIGNIQFGLVNNSRELSLYFIEISPRLSGSSYLNIENFNPIKYIMTSGREGVKNSYRQKLVSNKFLLKIKKSDWL